MSKRQNANVVLCEWLTLTPRELAQHRVAITKVNVPVYQIDGVFWCAPHKSGGAPRGWEWVVAGSIGERTILRSNHLIDPAMMN